MTDDLYVIGLWTGVSVAPLPTGTLLTLPTLYIPSTLPRTESVSVDWLLELDVRAVLGEEVPAGGRDRVLEDVGVARIELLAPHEVLHSQGGALDPKREVPADDGVRELVLGIVRAKEPAGAEGHVGRSARLQRQREARAARRTGIAREVVGKVRLLEIEIRRIGVGVVLESHDGICRVVQLGDLADPVRPIQLDPVGREWRRKNAVVPVALSEHASHVVGQGLVARQVIGRIVADIEGAEARAEAADAEVELVADAEVEVRHVELETMAPVADLHVGREVVGDVDRGLDRRFDGEALEGRGRAGRCDRRGLARHQVVVELGGPGEVALFVRPRRVMGEERDHRGGEDDEEEGPRANHGVPVGDDASGCVGDASVGSSSSLCSFLRRCSIE